MILYRAPVNPYGFQDAYLQLLKYTDNDYPFDCRMFLDVVELTEEDIYNPIPLSRVGVERDFCIFTCWGYTAEVRKFWLTMMRGMRRVGMHCLYFLFIKFMELLTMRRGTGRWRTLDVEEAEKTLFCLLIVLRDKGGVKLETALREEWEENVVDLASQKIRNAETEPEKSKRVEYFFYNFGDHEKYVAGLKILRGLEYANDRAFEYLHGATLQSHIAAYESLYGTFEGVFTELPEKDDRQLLSVNL